MFIVIEIIRAGIIGDIEIGPAIVVIVSPHHAQAIVVVGIVNPSFFGDLFESAVAAIVKEQVGLALHSPRTTLDADSLEAAGLLVAAESGQVVDIEMDIARHE